MKHFFNVKFLATTFLLCGLACSSSDSKTSSFDTPTTFFSTMTQMTIEIAYEPGAEPYTGNAPAIVGGKPLWDFVKDNLAALFEGRSTAVAITVPTTLEEMQAIPDQSKETFSSDAILAIATTYRKGKSSAAEGNFFMVFLDGYYEENGAKNDSVIGVSISGTTVLAMFKPVILSTSGGAAAVPKFVELTTAIHELGHALGLVNNGITMAASHQDTDHGKHCNNDQCVMYYLNEGAADLKTFVTQILTTGNTIVYDTNCLNDARGFKP